MDRAREAVWRGKLRGGELGGGRTVGRGDEWEGVRMRYCSGGGGGGGVTGRERAV